MTANMTVKTFEDTLREAQELGFETCRDTQTGITRRIDTDVYKRQGQYVPLSQRLGQPGYLQGRLGVLGIVIPLYDA